MCMCIQFFFTVYWNRSIETDGRKTAFNCASNLFRKNQSRFWILYVTLRILVFWFTVILMRNCVKPYVICTNVNNKYNKWNWVTKQFFYAWAVKKPEKFSIGAAQENCFGLLTAQALNTCLIGDCAPFAFFFRVIYTWYNYLSN